MPQITSDTIDDYEMCGNTLRAAVLGLTQSEQLARPITGRWSILEVVCHLVDSEIAWTHRMKRVMTEDRPLLIGYDETLFTAGLGYQERSLDDELELFERLRRQMAAIFRQAPTDAWERAGVHNERGLVTLAEMIRIEIEHVEHHLMHLRLKREALASQA